MYPVFIELCEVTVYGKKIKKYFLVPSFCSAFSTNEKDGRVFHLNVTMGKVTLNTSYYLKTQLFVYFLSLLVFYLYALAFKGQIDIKIMNSICCHNCVATKMCITTSHKKEEHNLMMFSTICLQRVSIVSWF